MDDPSEGTKDALLKKPLNVTPGLEEFLGGRRDLLAVMSSHDTVIFNSTLSVS